MRDAPEPPWVLVTGGAGFIGSSLVLGLIASRRYRVVTLDALTYAGNLENLAPLEEEPRHVFVRGDVRDGALVSALLAEHRPVGILHAAAETHVDRSIDGPAGFVQTNVVGTLSMLEVALDHWRGLDAAARERFRFVQVSTDEVYGEIDAPGRFTEDSPYRPNSPYAASKAAADGLVRAWCRTYGLPTVTTHGANNYGPRQFPEKLIPRLLLRALAGAPMPLYGDGLAIRDWIHVEDHCAALIRAMEVGAPGGVYLIGAENERTNRDVAEALAGALDRLAPRPGGHRGQIAYVPDRPGHDRRYALDAGRARRALGWAPRRRWEEALEATVRWYLENEGWWRRIQSGAYRDRLGLGGIP